MTEKSTDPSGISRFIDKKKLLPIAGAVIAILIGVAFAGPIRASLSGIGHLLGFGDRPADETAASDGSGQVQYYTCGMHPWVILPKPGDCPICHMELTPLDPAKFTGEIVIDPVVVQNMGVRVTPVVTGPLTRTIRTVGTVDYNERAVRDVNTKVSGWIEKLHVDYLGAKVQSGDPLFELYSPELYAAQNEYLLAWKNRNRTPASANILKSARTRLEYFDISDQQIEELQQSDEPEKTMTIRSPHTGVVIAKRANEGMKVDPGMQIFRIADLSKVWVLVTLYEYQLPYVEEGMKATMTLPYIPGQAFEGEVIYIYPYLEEKTREVQVRLEFENPNVLLKPGMFANVQLTSTLAAEKTLAPRSAIIDTGERQVAFVSRGEGKFEPREVTLGVTTGTGLVEIISGLKPGEMVVTSGQFLIDSEAKIREALGKMIRGDLASEQKVAAEMAGTSELDKLPDPVAAALDKALDHYLAIGDALASDTHKANGEHARQLAAALDQLIELGIPSHPHFWHKHQDAIATARASALKLADDGKLDQARLDFADLSAALESLLMATGVPPAFEREVQVLHCPMYREGQGGTIWLQTAGDVRNPYFGSTMLECFDERKTLPVTGQDGSSPSDASDHAPPGKREQSPGQAAVPPALQEAIDQMVTGYLEIQQSLTEDKWEDAPNKLAMIRRHASRLAAGSVDELARLAKPVEQQAAIKAAGSDEFRVAFSGLSDAILNLVRAFPPAQAAVSGLYHAYCPMVKKSWLQASDTIRNPYDTSMLGCGSIKQNIALRAARDGHEHDKD